MRLSFRLRAVDDHDRLLVKWPNPDAALRVFIDAAHLERDLSYPNIAGQGVHQGTPVEIDSHGGLTGRLEVEASDHDDIDVAVRLSYGNGEVELLQLTPESLSVRYPDFQRGVSTSAQHFVYFVWSPTAHTVLAVEYLGLFAVILAWVAVRMFRDGGLVDKKRLDRRFYPNRWLRWRP